MPGIPKWRGRAPPLGMEAGSSTGPEPAIPRVVGATGVVIVVGCLTQNVITRFPTRDTFESHAASAMLL